MSLGAFQLQYLVIVLYTIFPREPVQDHLPLTVYYPKFFPYQELNIPSSDAS